MPRLLFAFVIVFLLFGCNNTQTSRNLSVNSTSNNEAKFAVEPEMHNFGELESGEVISFSFKYTNTGEGTLHIDSVDGGCGCIEIELKDEVLKANESSFFTVVYNTAGEWGNILKPIILYTNTLEKRKEIFITAKVNNELFK